MLNNGNDSSNITYTWIETYTGEAFDVAKPNYTLVHPEDIAHSLSLQCRFNGHSSEFYSVAEHCVRVHDAMAYDNQLDKIRMLGILHDASEAYLCDVPSPIKRMLPQYAKLEEEIQDVVWKRFDLNPSSKDKKIVKKYDRMLLLAEAKYLMSSGGKTWGYEIESKDIFIVPMLPNVARREFLYRLSLYGLY